MSTGALTQLVAIGAQETNFLSNDTKDSVFQEKDVKINNFVKSTSSMQPLGSSNWGTTTKFKIEKKGDMLSSVYFVAKLPTISRDYLQTNSSNYYVRWVNYVGNVLIENVKLYIGGQLIDEQSGDFNQIYTDLYDDDWNKLCMIGCDESLTKPNNSQEYPIESAYVYVPLKFWFCNNLTKALPLIAMQYHDVEIEVKIRDWDSCYQVLEKKTDSEGKNGFVHIQEFNKMNQQPLEGVRLDCNFIYLASEDRKRVAQQEHKILITQTQKISCSVSQGKNVDLSVLNHPVKELFFYFSNKHIRNLPDPYNFSTKGEFMPKIVYDHHITTNNGTFEEYIDSNKNHTLGEARIMINGYPRVEWKDYKYYYYLQNYENYRNKMEHNVYLYSFSSKPKSDTPMGSINFSRIDNAQLQFTINEKSRKEHKKWISSNDYDLLDDSNKTITVYAINYNYLLVKSGMAGLAYST